MCCVVRGLKNTKCVSCCVWLRLGPDTLSASFTPPLAGSGTRGSDLGWCELDPAGRGPVSRSLPPFVHPWCPVVVHADAFMCLQTFSMFVCFSLCVCWERARGAASRRLHSTRRPLLLRVSSFLMVWTSAGLQCVALLSSGLISAAQ